MLEAILNPMQTLTRNRILENDKLADRTKRKRTEKKIWKTFGLAREKGEKFDEFLERVRETLHNKDRPFGWIPLSYKRKLLKGIKNKAKTTKRVQGVTEEFLGIKKEPLDAYEGESLEGTNGFNVSEPDGSGSIVVKNGLEDDYENDIQNFKYDLRRYLKGRTIDKYSLNNTDIFMFFSHDDKDEELKIFSNWFESIFNNFDYIALHEGIHNIEGNARNGETKKYVKKCKGKVRGLLSKIPVLMPFATQFSQEHTIEFESAAFKIGTDAYIQKSFRDARAQMTLSKDEIEKLNELEGTFYEMSSTFSKRIIDFGYLKFGGAMKSFTIAGGAALASYFLDIDNPQNMITQAMDFMSQSLEYVQYAFNLNGLVQIPFYLNGRKKSEKYVDSWQTILKEKGIQEGSKALKLNGKQRVQFAQKLEERINS